MAFKRNVSLKKEMHKIIGDFEYFIKLTNSEKLEFLEGIILSKIILDFKKYKKVTNQYKDNFSKNIKVLLEIIKIRISIDKNSNNQIDFAFLIDNLEGDKK